MNALEWFALRAATRVRRPEMHDRRRPDRRRALAIVSVVAISVTLFASCSAPALERTHQVAASSVPTGRSVGTATPNATPSTEDSYLKATDFSITVYQGEDTLGGKTVLLSQILGQGKPVVPNMWAGLCPPCRTEMLGLQKVYDQFKDRVSFVGLDMGEYTGLGTREDGHKLIQDLKITYPIGNTEDGEVLLAAYGVRGMPTTFFIRANGDLIGRAIGEIDSDQLVKIINEELLR